MVTLTLLYHLADQRLVLKGVYKLSALGDKESLEGVWSFERITFTYTFALVVTSMGPCQSAEPGFIQANLSKIQGLFKN